MSRFTKQALQEKTKNELLKIANGQFGLGLKATMKKMDIVNYIMHNINRAGTDQVEILSDEQVRSTQQNDLPEGYAIIRLDKGKYNPAGRPQYVGASNVKKQSNCLIPVGKPVKIHEKFLEPLIHAVKMEVYQDPATLEEEERETHVYPFTILKHNQSEWWRENHGDEYSMGLM